jgi:hypothetical protein
LVIKALDPDWIRIRIGIQPKMLELDPDKMNADPKPWRRTLIELRSTQRISSQ